MLNPGQVGVGELVDRATTAGRVAQDFVLELIPSNEYALNLMLRLGMSSSSFILSTVSLARVRLDEDDDDVPAFGLDRGASSGISPISPAPVA